MTESLAVTRSSVLARFVLNAPEQKLGRTQLMKLFYFLQELKGVDLGYDFRLFTYGPFDSEVLSDLATACGMNNVHEQPVIHPRGYGYKISPGTNAIVLNNAFQMSSPATAVLVDDVIKEFSSFSAAELELRSTVLFVDREFKQSNTTISPLSLAKKVREIKPHFSESLIHDRVQEMVSKQWLQSVVDQSTAC